MPLYSLISLQSLQMGVKLIFWSNLKLKVPLLSVLCYG